MAYRVPLPAGGRRRTVDLIDPTSTGVQRYVRRYGLGAYEPSTSAAMLTLAELARPEFVVFDVGSNMGLYSVMIAAMFDPGAVHSFEATPDTAAIASRIARRNNVAVHVHQLALSDRSGHADLYLSPVSDSSNSLVEGFRETEQTVAVPTSTMDAFVAAHDVEPDIIKIDVETHERAVLDGARETIERTRPALVVEVLRRRGRDHGVEIGEFFDGLGYHYYELSATPSWEARDQLRGSGTTDRDWLLTPDPLPDEFADRWSHWAAELARCDATRNPRIPVVASVRAAYARGGAREVVATARRWFAESEAGQPAS